VKISAIRVYQVDLPLVEGRYSWSEGKYVEVFDSTVVELLTDDGNSGFGEVCPLGPFYLPAFGAGARAGIAELAPTLIGQDPTKIGPINRLMDRALLGHPYVKSAIDMACWDLLGKATGKSVCDLMGGKFGDSVALYRAISQRPADEMAENVAGYRAEGYTKFQLKVGGRPSEDIERIHAAADILTDGEVLVADANTGWRVDDAARVVNAVRDRDVYIEQPCRSYEHCLSIRPQDLEGRGTYPCAPDSRPLRVTQYPDDDRGQLGRRHHYGGNRPSGTFDARGNAVFGNRLQQLRQRAKCNRRAAKS
jgi:L-alanine-DL-glutamate epimerase-like enolase superfamily enzyme